MRTTWMRWVLIGLVAAAAVTLWWLDQDPAQRPDPTPPPTATLLDPTATPSPDPTETPPATTATPDPTRVAVTLTAIATEMAAATAVAPIATAPVPTLSVQTAALLEPAGPTPAPLLPSTRRPAGPALAPAADAGGRWVVFAAEAPNLVVDDDNGVAHLFLFDRETETLRLLSAGPDGTAGDGWSQGPAISADGSTVAFYSWAGNLVADDTNFVRDLFAVDRESGAVTRLSVAADGRQANDRSGDNDPATRPALSGDGRLVLFFSAADNLVDGDDNGVTDLFLHDRETADIRRLSLTMDGLQADGPTTYASISADGRFVAFQSQATNLLGPEAAPAFAAGVDQIYLLDRESSALTLLSRAPGRRDPPRPGAGGSTHPAISADGRFIAFVSAAPDLVERDRNGVADIFVYERESGLLERVSVAASGVQANGPSGQPALSGDGRYVAFVSAANNLVSGDTNEQPDLFIHDRHTRQTVAVAPEVDGAHAMPWLDGEGLLLLFSATGLPPADRGDGVAQIYVQPRSHPVTYAVSGRVVDSQDAPVADVRLSAGRMQAFTDAQGIYTVTNLVAGTYSLVPAKNGYSFSAPRRIVSVSPAYQPGPQPFLALEDGSPPAPFMDLPLAYGGDPARFLRILQDVEEGGRINAWFDHAAPNQTRNQRIVLWTGRSHTRNPYNLEFGCYERRCYDGHNGVDFPYRDPNGTTPDLGPEIAIYPVADGVVAQVITGCPAVDPTPTPAPTSTAVADAAATGGEDSAATAVDPAATAPAGGALLPTPTRAPSIKEACGLGFGNNVILNHRNGYFTRYAHLATVGVAPGQEVSTLDALGIMGSTGRSNGLHLHLGVYRDNGNGRWDGDPVDRPVDPFGWAGVGPDPWVTAGGPVSHWLWLHSPEQQTAFLGSQGATLITPARDVQVVIPSGALAGQVTMELTGGSGDPAPAPGLRTVGHGVGLHIVEWLQGGAQAQAAASSAELADLSLAVPLELTMRYAPAAIRHLDAGRLTLVRWESATEEWRPLATRLDPENSLAVARSDRLGRFALQGPLLCPADDLEPDDGYFAAGAPDMTGGWQARLLGIPEDEDWLRVEVTAGRSYRLEVQPTAPAVRVHLTRYATDGVTPLDETRARPGQATALAWQAPADGTVFLRMAPTTDSLTGCQAGYEARLVVE